MLSQKSVFQNSLAAVLICVILYAFIAVIPHSLFGFSVPLPYLVRMALNLVLWFVVAPFVLRLPAASTSLPDYLAHTGLKSRHPVLSAILIGTLLYLIYAAFTFIIKKLTGTPFSVLHFSPFLRWSTWLDVMDAGIFEEIAARGVVLVWLLKRTRTWPAILFSSALVAVGRLAWLLHGLPLNSVLVEVGIAFLAGITFALPFVKTRSLVPGILAHVLINIFNVTTISVRDSGWDSALPLVGWALTLLGALLLCKFAVNRLDRALMRPLPLATEGNLQMSQSR